MDKQTAQRLLDEMPEGTTHYDTTMGVHPFLKSSGDVNGYYWYVNEWNEFVNLISYVGSECVHTVEQLREIANESTVTRDEALQWCVDNVTTWPDKQRKNAPTGWEWMKARNGDLLLIDNVSDDTVLKSNWEYASYMKSLSLYGTTVTRDEALHWCVDNVTVWGNSGETPDGWGWATKGYDDLVLITDVKNYITMDDWKNVPRHNVTTPTFTIPDDARAHSHYYKSVSHLDFIDIYRVLDLYSVTNPCVQHAVKKQLCAGDRGIKDTIKDYKEAIDSLNRAIEMLEEDERK